MSNTFFNEISDDELIMDRFEIFKTDNGFMPYDNDCGEYLCDAAGNNCFDDYWQALQLVNDAIFTINEHLGA
jgi:hypothetical protein